MSSLQTHLVLLPPSLPLYSELNLEAQLLQWVHVTVCVASVKTSVSAWPGCQSQEQGFKPPCADMRGWEVVSTSQPPAADEVILITSCHCLEIRVSTAISFPSCVCAFACNCVCVCVWDGVSEGMQRSHRGRTIIYPGCILWRERGKELPGCFLNFIFLTLFIRSRSTEHTRSLSSVPHTYSLRCICCWESLWI